MDIYVLCAYLVSVDIRRGSWVFCKPLCACKSGSAAKASSALNAWANCPGGSVHFWVQYGPCSFHKRGEVNSLLPGCPVQGRGRHTEVLWEALVVRIGLLQRLVSVCFINFVLKTITDLKVLVKQVCSWSHSTVENAVLCMLFLLEGMEFGLS